MKRKSTHSSKTASFWASVRMKEKPAPPVTKSCTAPSWRSSIAREKNAAISMPASPKRWPSCGRRSPCSCGRATDGRARPADAQRGPQRQLHGAPASGLCHDQTPARDLAQDLHADRPGGLGRLPRIVLVLPFCGARGEGHAICRPIRCAADLLHYFVLAHGASSG